MRGIYVSEILSYHKDDVLKLRHLSYLVMLFTMKTMHEISIKSVLKSTLSKMQIKFNVYFFHRDARSVHGSRMSSRPRVLASSMTIHPNPFHFVPGLRLPTIPP